jgi:hypothetical protein
MATVDINKKYDICTLSKEINRQLADIQSLAEVLNCMQNKVRTLHKVKNTYIRTSIAALLSVEV